MWGVIFMFYELQSGGEYIYIYIPTTVAILAQDYGMRPPTELMLDGSNEIPVCTGAA